MQASLVGIWLAEAFAKSWYRDARGEADTPGADARRREIVFAIACAESFLFEWVRDDVLGAGDMVALPKYFPDGARRGIRKRWPSVIKALHADGRIVGLPNVVTSRAWQSFCQLVEYRDGLLHAGASRPSGTGVAAKAEPKPSMRELDELGGGWAADVVAELIRELCSAARTQSPSWI
jgi:hypothetical protein